MNLHVDIVSAEGEVYAGPAAMVFVIGEMGELGILPQHAPLLTRIRPGPVRICHDDEPEELLFVSGGLLEVQPHQVTVLADTAERAAEIDEAAAQRAKRRAEDTISSAADQVSLARAQAELAEAVARLEIVKRIWTQLP
ncbi:F0F1 ATP synthase subunit epsilon [Salinisphaera sp. LB1]|uniref:F0F1 ATP synthase subunit epsilon n=1 Tax=Salinisphaera sp. LB1 TaxID=2183911 RepID=UPI000D706614|nr:F0F1 ATP synthase subunit epsilon [Salinisphaera sp. LB1]AWN17944.1 ATP synthase epsilon chain [Salinisphaera sp. LB1]